MSIDADMITLIDQRIRAQQQMTRAIGSCVNRDTTGPGAQVLFDGSTVAMPVKVLGHVFLAPGNRCVLDRYGSDWVVTGSWSALGLGEARRVTLASGTSGAMTSASFIDLTEFGTFTFTKIYDNTMIRCGMEVGGFCTGSGSTGARYGLRLAPTDAGSSYTATDYNCTTLYWNSTNVHLQNYSTLAVLSVPAGTYTVTMRWRRNAGSGSIFVDTADQLGIELDEMVRSASPIL